MGADALDVATQAGGVQPGGVRSDPHQHDVGGDGDLLTGRGTPRRGQGEGALDLDVGDLLDEPDPQPQVVARPRRLVRTGRQREQRPDLVDPVRETAREQRAGDRVDRHVHKVVLARIIRNSTEIVV